MKRRIAWVALVSGLLLALPVPAATARPGFVFPAGCCLYEGQTVRTVVPPSAFPGTGVDNFYAVMGGTAEQKAVVAVAPGDIGYHGGRWAFHAVAWNTAPYLLGSEADVLAAGVAGDVTVTPDASKDFLCPIQL